MTAVLEVCSLRKSYGTKVAVNDISFSVERNEIVGLLGPNGAGKTTTINMILGVLTPDAGTVSIEGHNIATARSKALEHTNFAAVYAPLPGNLSVYQNLKIFGLLYSVPNLAKRIDDLLTQFDLRQLKNTRCGLLSSGEQTRASLAKAMLNRPSLLLLDEPTASLDPSAAKDTRAMIRDFTANDHCAVLWTSHNMHEVEEVCHRVLFLSRGRVLLEGNPKSLPAEHGKSTLEDLFITVAKEPLSLEER